LPQSPAAGPPEPTRRSSSVSLSIREVFALRIRRSCCSQEAVLKKSSGAELVCGSRQEYPERMPTVLRVGGYRLHFYSDEGIEPPHIHVRCADGECKFWLDPVALARNRGVPAHTVRDMERLVYKHADLLLEKYDEHHPPGNRSRGDESLD